MTVEEMLDFVRRHGIVLESARGVVPNAVEAIVGGSVKGSWWGHPRGNEIFNLLQNVRDSKDILVCRLVAGKITYVHRALWPALVKLATKLPKQRITAIQEIHTPSGKHKVVTTPFPKWVPSEVARAAKKLSIEEASRALRLVLEQNH